MGGIADDIGTLQVTAQTGAVHGDIWRPLCLLGGGVASQQN